MNQVLILEDNPNLQGDNKSLRLAKSIAAEGYDVRLCDGRTISRYFLGDNKQLTIHENEKVFLQTGAVNSATPADVVSWICSRLANCETLVLVVDLQFGDDSDYGYKIYQQLRRQSSFSPKLEPIVYSRWVNDDTRATLLKNFHTPGDRMLQRDVDGDEMVIELINKIFNP
jgi:hypothetical protein